jgi:hypothetical protein
VGGGVKVGSDKIYASQGWLWQRNSAAYELFVYTHAQRYDGLRLGSGGSDRAVRHIRRLAGTRTHLFKCSGSLKLTVLRGAMFALDFVVLMPRGMGPTADMTRTACSCMCLRVARMSCDAWEPRQFGRAVAL